ncbi:MAG: hypothetical protein R6V15_10140 [Desulfotignum sp.]
MENDRIINNTMPGLSDLPFLPALADMEGRYAQGGIYPEEDELASALCLVNLMISRNRIFRNEPSAGRAAQQIKEF